MSCVFVEGDFFYVVMGGEEDGFVGSFVNVFGFYVDKVVFKQVEVVDVVGFVQFVEFGENGGRRYCCFVDGDCIVFFEVDFDDLGCVWCFFWVVCVLKDIVWCSYVWIFKYFVFV